MALRIGSAGLLYEAVRAAVGAGGHEPLLSGDGESLPELVSNSAVECSGLRPSSGGSRRLTLNNRLRTGTDQGSPTV